MKMIDPDEFLMNPIGKIQRIDLSGGGLKITAELNRSSDALDAMYYAHKFMKKESFNMTKKTMKDVDRIVITKKDGDKVLLRAYSGDDIVEKKEAKCSPDDIFDFNIGAKLCVDRLYEGYDMTSKPKYKPFTGTIFVQYEVQEECKIDPVYCKGKYEFLSWIRTGYTIQKRNKLIHVENDGFTVEGIRCVGRYGNGTQEEVLVKQLQVAFDHAAYGSSKYYTVIEAHVVDEEE